CVRGVGTDPVQPTLGDYSQAVSQNGQFYAAYAMTTPPPGGFVNGQPDTGMNVPNIEFKRVSQLSHTDVTSLPLSIDVNGVNASDIVGNHNGFLDPGETIRVR